MRILNVLVASDPREQQEIAAEAGISSGYLTQILKGDRPLTVNSLSGLSRALKVDADVLAEEFTKDELIDLARLKVSQEPHRQLPSEATGDPSVYPGALPLRPDRRLPYGEVVPGGDPSEPTGIVVAPHPPKKKRRKPNK